MKKNLNISKKLIFKIFSIIIISFVITFLSGFFITSLYNNQNSYYQASFTYEGEKNLYDMINKEYLEEIKNSSYEKYQSINVDKLLASNDFILTNEGNYYTIKTKIKYYDSFFFISKQSVGTRAKTFIRDCLTNYIENDETIDYQNPDDIVELKNSFSPYYGGLIASSFGILFSIILVSYYLKNENYEIEDNINLFHTPFHINYWKGQLSKLKNTKSLVVLAMLFSMLLVSKLFSLPSGFGNLGIGFGFIFLSIIGLIYGPTVSIIIGFFSDIIGFFITPQQGMFYIGYTLQACLASFTYGLCFYKTRINFSKVLLARFIVNIFLNVILGSYLQCRIFMMSGSLASENFFLTFKAYALLYSLPKNIIYLLPQSIALYFVIKVVTPILSRFKIIEYQNKNLVTLL